MITILLALLISPERYVIFFAYAATFFTILSAFYYVAEGIRQLNASPASAASLSSLSKKE
jgi:hypothetical protein